MNIKNILPLIILIIVWLFPQNLSAETAEDFFNQSTWDVCLRAYDFDRDYGNKNLLDQRAFSLGGAFNFLKWPRLLAWFTSWSNFLYRTIIGFK